MSSPRPKRLLAVDLDGTLLDARHRVPPRNRAALHDAHESGLKIVLCTGRSYTETRPILDELGLELDATVTVGGALLSDARSGKTIARRELDLSVAQEAARWFQQRGYSVMWLRDASETGFDGYLIEGPRRRRAIEEWFIRTPCQMRTVTQVPDDGRAPLRVTVVDEIEPLDRVSVDFRRVFDGRLNHNVIRVPTYGFTVLEAFDAVVDKWYGITTLCGHWQIDPRDTVAVGDDVNDIPMVRNAGLGAAVANAKPSVKAVAQVIVASNDDCGVADLIAQLLRDR